MKVFEAIVDSLPNFADMTGYQPPESGLTRRTASREWAAKLLRMVAVLTILTQIGDLGFALWLQEMALSRSAWVLHLFAISSALLVFVATFVRPAGAGDNWELYAFMMSALVLGAMTVNGLICRDTMHVLVFILLYAGLTPCMLPWRPRWQAGFGALTVGYFAVALCQLRPELSVAVYWTYGAIAGVGAGQFISILMNQFRETVSAELQALVASDHQLRAEAADRATAEQRLARSELNFRTLIDRSVDAIAVTSLPDLRFVMVNPAFEKVFGLTRDEVIGRPVTDFNFAPDEADYLRSADRIASTILKKGGFQGASMRLVNRRGEWITMLISAVKIEWDGAPCALFMHRDITSMKEAETNLRAEVAERQKTEERLRASEAILRGIFEASPNVISLARLSDGAYVSVNDSFVKQLGFSREEAIGKNPRQLGIWADLPQARTIIQQLHDKSVVSDVQVEVRHKDGTVAPYVASMARTDIGSDQYVVAVIHNISKLKNTEKELIRAREDALAASKAKSEFLSSMSHEIRTPMNAILGMTELLSETELDQQQQKFLSIIENNGNALLQLINDILDLAKVESGRLSLEKTSFELDNLVEKAAETLSVRAHSKGLELVARVAPGTPVHLLGDQLRLRQILLNLIGNAIKFTERGEIVLTVDKARESSELGHLHFTVADTGIGIGPDHIDQVFQNFTQADSSITRRYGGSGLGLAIVKRLVELKGGRLWVESELGKGSIFHFTAQYELDLESHPAELPTGPEGRSLAGLRMLIVDDNATNRLLLREMLAPLGARLTEAESGAEAVAEIEHARRTRDPYHLMLLDCRMPEMDGFQVMERLGCATSDAMVVLMLTSDDLSMTDARARELNLDAYMVKPIRKQELLRTIESALKTGKLGVRLLAQPLPQPAATESVLPSQPEAEAVLRILLADDAADNRLLVQTYLRKSAYQLTMVENGQLAVEQFMHNSFDIVIMDIQMPVMDGHQAIRLIREYEAREGRTPTPILALTASAFAEDVDHCISSGATAHVAKPVKKAVLLAAIQQHTNVGTGSSLPPAITADICEDHALRLNGTFPFTG
jgi:PAS domain S-box-containing protein